MSTAAPLFASTGFWRDYNARQRLLARGADRDLMLSKMQLQRREAFLAAERIVEAQAIAFSYGERQATAVKVATFEQRRSL